MVCHNVLGGWGFMGMVSEHGKVLRVLRKSQSMECSNSRVDLVVLERGCLLGDEWWDMLVVGFFNKSACQDS